jgi:carbon-monoxide dehydrogenase large subunit
VDAIAKVTGRAKYTEDFRESGMLQAKILRSPHPHAKILYIDTSKVQKMPGVRAVITGTDMPERRVGHLVFDQYPIARDTVRYIGEPVAVVAADTVEIAEDALGLINVDYEELPVVYDVEEAIQSNCPAILHPALTNYRRAGVSGIRAPDKGNGNIFFHWGIRNGHVEKDFEKAALVVENRYSVQRINHGCIETNIADAWVDDEGTLTIRSPRQGPGLGKPHICEFFDLTESRVRMIEPYLGGSFGGKGDLWIEMIVARLAQETSRPVRLVLTREEVLKTVARARFVVYVKDGVKRDGSLVAREVKVFVDSGAYSQIAAPIVRNSGFAAIGTYRIPSFKWDSYGVYTNHCPSTAFRGFGAPEIQWAIEQQMEIIAEKLGMDSAKLRRKNILKEGEKNAQGQITRSIGAKKCLDKVVEWLERNGPHEPIGGPWKRGKGIALANKYTVAATTSCVHVKVHPDNVVEVRHSLDEMGQGINTVVAQVAAEEFGIPSDNVKVVWGDTAFMPYDWVSMASRSTWQLGHATQRACQDAKRQIFELAALKLGANVRDLETHNWNVYVKECPSKATPISDLFSPLGIVPGLGDIMGQGEYTSPKIPEDEKTGLSEKAATSFAHGACGVEIAVNTETGEVRVERIVCAFDMGQPINPKMCEQQIEGGLVQAIGSTLYEEMLTENGAVTNPTFLDYKIPTTMDIPSRENMKCILAPVPDPEGPFGAKALGEAVLAPIAPAIGNAFCNATGVRKKDLPFTREKVLEAIKNKSKS